MDTDATDHTDKAFKFIPCSSVFFRVLLGFAVYCLMFHRVHYTAGKRPDNKRTCEITWLWYNDPRLSPCSSVG